MLRCVRIFQTAFTLRVELDVGRTAPVVGSGSVKPRIPCLSARMPVAIEVHSMGDRIGCSVARFPITPSSTIFPSVGMSPWSING